MTAGPSAYINMDEESEVDEPLADDTITIDSDEEE